MSGFIFNDENQDEHLTVLKNFAFSISLSIPVFTTAPTDNAIGYLYFNLTDNKLYVSTGTTSDDWHPIALEYPALDSIGALTTTGGQFIYTVATDTYTTAPIGAAGISFLSMPTVGNQQTALNLVPGVNVQSHSSILDAVISSAANTGQLLYTNGGTIAGLALATFVQNNILNCASAAALRSNIGLSYLPSSNTNLSSDGLVGLAATQTLTNKTLDTTATGNNTLILGANASLNGVPFSTNGTPQEGYILAIAGGVAQWAAPTLEIGDITQNVYTSRIVTSSTVFANTSDTTNTVAFDTSGITGAETIIIPNAPNDTFATQTAVQTFTNKTMTDSTNDITASGLFANNGSTTVNVSGATGPTGGQVLIACSGTQAMWGAIPNTFMPGRTIFVYQGATNAPAYTTLNAALTAAIALTPTVMNPVVIQMYPGTYTETVPMVVPAYICITTTSNAPGTVVIRPSVGSTPIFTINGNARLDSLTINGETSPGSGVYSTIGINCVNNGSSTADWVTYCMILNCTTAGLRIMGNGTQYSKICTCTNILVQVTVSPITMVAAYEIMQGALFLGTSISVTGYQASTSVICYGVYTHDDYSFCDLNVVQINTCQVGISTGTGVISNLQSAYPTTRIIGASLGMIGTVANGFMDGIALYMQPKSVVRISEVRINEDVIPIAMHFYSVNPALPANPNFIASMWMNARMDKVNILGGALNNLPIMRGSNLSEIPSDVINQFAGDISVGMPSYSASLIAGEGASHIMGMWVFNISDTGTCVDRSTAGKLLDGTAFPAFVNANVGNMLYITTNAALGIFPGIKIAFTGGYTGSSPVIQTIAWEYWNGSAWSTMPLMSSLAIAPFTPKGNITMAANDIMPIGGFLWYNYRFSRCFDWATALGNTVGINTLPAGMQNIPRYWLRARVAATGMTSIPLIDQIKLRTNSTKINNNGFTECFGSARLQKQIPMNLVGAMGSMPSGNPGSANVYLSDGIFASRNLNIFTNNGGENVGYVTEIPGDIDTSDYLQIVLRWINSEVNNTVVWNIAYGWSTDFVVDGTNNSNVDVTVPGTPSNNIFSAQISSLVASSTGKMNTSVISLDIQSIIATRGSLGTGDVLWYTLSRTPSTNNGNATLIQISAYYTSWNR